MPPVRLLGVGVTGIVTATQEQLALFGEQLPQRVGDGERHEEHVGVRALEERRQHHVAHHAQGPRQQRPERDDAGAAGQG